MMRSVVSMCVLLFLCAVGVEAKPSAIVPPVPEGPYLQSGSDTLRFSGQPGSLRGDRGPQAVLVVRSIMFVAKGYRNLGVVSPTHPQVREIASRDWFVANRRELSALVLPGPGAGEIHCTIPPESEGMVVSFLGPNTTHPSPIHVTLNDSTMQFLPLRGLREVCLRLERRNGSVRFAAADPIYNLWVTRPRKDEAEGITKEVDLSPDNEPLTSGQYVLHVKYSLDPKEQFKGDAIADVACLDLTPYDGYVFSVKSSVPTKAYSHMRTADNFSWRGGAQSVDSSGWTQWAAPFEKHDNPTAAGDGVLKLSEVHTIQVNIVPRRNREGNTEGEFWVKPPQFYKGALPTGASMALFRSPAVQHCDLISLSPRRRTAPFFDGISVQALAQNGDMVWVGTNQGVFKISRKQPGMVMAHWGQDAGLLDEDVQSVRPDGDQVWIGTVCGLSCFDGKQFRNYTTEDGLLPGPVMAISTTPDSVWLGMTRGIARLDKRSGKIFAYKRRGGWAPESTGGQGVPVEEGRAVYADSLALAADGTVWHGAAGVDHTGADGKPLEHFFGSTSRTIAVYPGRDYVWTVSSRGLTCMRDNGDVVRDFPLRQRLGPQPYASDSRIIAACPEQDTIWIAYNDGIGWLSISGQTQYWSPKFSVELGSLVPQCLLADKDYLWVGTDNGLLLLNKADAGKPWTVLDYNCPADVYAAGIDLDEEEQPRLYGGMQKVSIDTDPGVDGEPGSLCMEFALGQDPHSACALEQHFGLDLSGFAGLSFYAKTSDARRRFYVELVRVDNPTRPRKTETYRAPIDVSTSWQRIVLPFSAFQRTSPKPKIRDNTAFAGSLTLRRDVADFGCAGDKGKVWIDHLQWLKPGERLGPTININEPVKEAAAR